MLAAAVLLQATVPAFAPPLDRALLVRTERIEDAAGERRFTLERVVRFVREDGGYRAEVQIREARSDAAEPVGGMTEAAFAGLIGRTVVIHFDGQGRLTGIDDMAAHWERLTQAIGTIAATHRGLPPAERPALARRIAMPLRAMPAERQRSALASLASAILPEEPPEPVGISRPVVLPGTSPFGQPVLLKGTKQTRLADGTIEAVTRAAADIASPGQGATPPRSGRIELERSVQTNPATGLIMQSRETVWTRLGTRATRRITRIAVLPAPASP